MDSCGHLDVFVRHCKCFDASLRLSWSCNSKLKELPGYIASDPDARIHPKYFRKLTCWSLRPCITTQMSRSSCRHRTLSGIKMHQICFGPALCFSDSLLGLQLHLI